ncbi:MAG: DUF2512 family protein [Syntrophomonadaceae bacterium]|nr:DUF2512 family protein [Syntrophomonadaceae bacterium]
MNTWMALIGKYLLTFIAGYLTFALIDGMLVSTVAIIALIATAVNYLIGDLAILPKYGNVIAAVGDGLMAAVFAYITVLLWPNMAVSWMALILFAIIVAIAEYFFHMYLQSSDKVAPDTE